MRRKTVFILHAVDYCDHIIRISMGRPSLDDEQICYAPAPKRGVSTLQNVANLVNSLILLC